MSLDVKLGDDGETVIINGTLEDVPPDVLKVIRQLVKDNGWTEQEAVANLMKFGAKLIREGQPTDGQHRDQRCCEHPSSSHESGVGCTERIDAETWCPCLVGR